VIPIAGATSVKQLRENLKATELVLDEATLKELDQASAFDLGHPYSMVDWEMQKTLGYGGMFDQIDMPYYPSGR
jgi:diketogulonate reductase-like aldo/keto reductase